MGRLHTYLEALKKRQPQEYDAEVIKDAIEQLRAYGSPRVIKEIMMSRAVEGFSVDDLYDVILALTPELKKGAGLSGGGYAYYPNKTLTVWETSDGGKVRGKLLDIMAYYMFQDADEAAEWLTMEPDYAMEELLTGRHDQAGYEGRQMRGDKYMGGKKSEVPSQYYEMLIRQKKLWAGNKKMTRTDANKIKAAMIKKFNVDVILLKEGDEFLFHFTIPKTDEELSYKIDPILKDIFGFYWRNFLHMEINELEDE